MKKVISVFLPLLFTVAMVAFPTDAMSAQTTPTPKLSISSPGAITADEKALINDILKELDLARKLTTDKNTQNQIGIIRDWVKKAQALAERGDTKAALEIKYTIAKRLEWLINQVPMVTPGAATTAAAPTANPLYDELVRIRAKIDKLIELEEREIPTITPYEPPDIQRPPEMEKLIVYSAKFLCGPALGGEGVQPGSYSTAINIHNPHNDTVYLFKKAVIAQREDEPRGRISAFRKVRLSPDEAIEVDCIDIVRLFGAKQETEVTAPSQQTQTVAQTTAVRPLTSAVSFIKGFVVIYATAPLDVVGVYTASTPVGFSLDVEQIPRSTIGVIPIPIPEEPTCPQGCYCMTKDEAYKKFDTGATLCQDAPCDKDASGVLRYCWKPAEQVCPTGCVCLTKEDAYNRYGQNVTLCQDAPCDKDASGALKYCWKPAEVTCPQGCYCLTKADADSRGYTTLCQEQPCAYVAGATTAMQPAKYCWKPPAQVICPQGCFCVTEAEAKQNGYTLCQNQRILCEKGAVGAADKYCFQKPPQITCPQGCYCLTKADASSRGYTDLCSNQPCGYDQYNNPIYCYKPPPQVTCPQGCLCVTEAEAKQNGYVLCQNQRLLCGKSITGASMYCFQKPVYRLQ